MPPYNSLQFRRTPSPLQKSMSGQSPQSPSRESKNSPRSSKNSSLSAFGEENSSSEFISTGKEPQEVVVPPFEEFKKQFEELLVIFQVEIPEQRWRWILPLIRSKHCWSYLQTPNGNFFANSRAQKRTFKRFFNLKALTIVFLSR